MLFEVFWWPICFSKLLSQIIIINVLLFSSVPPHPLNKLTQNIYEEMAYSILVALFCYLVKERQSLPKVLCLVANCCLLNNISQGTRKLVLPMGTLMPNLLTELVGLSSLLNEFAILVQFFQMFITACTSDEVLAQVLGDFKRISLKFIAFFFSITLALLLPVRCLYQIQAVKFINDSVNFFCPS